MKMKRKCIIEDMLPHRNHFADYRNKFEYDKSSRKNLEKIYSFG